MNNPSQLWATLIIDQFVKNGVVHFFCCPGMRNAPFLKAIAQNPKAHAYSGIDERAQSYRALALMKEQRTPVALVCTSGTAVANFLPSVIEAQKTHLPLFIISADRPGELNGTDANQTINQVEVLRDYTKDFWSASEPQNTFPPRALSGKINFLISKALKSPRGPIHLNVPLREPLDHQAAPVDDKWKEEIHHILKESAPSLKVAKTTTNLSPQDINQLFGQLTQSKRPLIVFGPLGAYDQYEIGEVKKFIENYHGSFFCDVATGLKYSFGCEDGLVPSLDHPEVLSCLEEKRPDLVIHFGHRLTSKHYYGLLSKLEGARIVHVSDGDFHEDPGFSFTDRWMIKSMELIKAFNELNSNTNGFEALVDWKPLIERKRATIEKGELTYPFLTKRAVDTFNGDYLAFIGNSTFIRSFDSYAGLMAPQSPWHVLTNRGASGIEGHLSMAAGMMLKASRPGLAFIGDVSFLHDLSALTFFSQNKPKLLVIIANNAQGGIFNLLPIAKDPDGEQYHHLMTTPHQENIEGIIKSFGLNCASVSTKEDYQKSLDDWKKQPELLFLNVVFNDQDNREVYKELKTLKL